MVKPGKLEPEEFLRLHRVIEKLRPRPGQDSFHRAMPHPDIANTRIIPKREVVYSAEVIRVKSGDAELPVDPKEGIAARYLLHYDSALDRTVVTDDFMESLREYVTYLPKRKQRGIGAANYSQSAKTVKEYLLEEIYDTFGSDHKALWQHQDIWSIKKRRNGTFERFIRNYKQIYFKLIDFSTYNKFFKYLVRDTRRGGLWWMFDYEWDSLGDDSSDQANYREMAKATRYEIDHQKEIREAETARLAAERIERERLHDEIVKARRERKEKEEAEWRAKVAKDQQEWQDKIAREAKKKLENDQRLIEQTKQYFSKSLERQLNSCRPLLPKMKGITTLSTTTEPDVPKSEVAICTVDDIVQGLINGIDRVTKITHIKPVWRNYRIWGIDPVSVNSDFDMWVNKYRMKYLVPGEIEDGLIKVSDIRIEWYWYMKEEDWNKL